MRTGTYNRFQNLWLYNETLHGTPFGADYEATTFRDQPLVIGGCQPGSGFWSLAEIGNRMTTNGNGATAAGTYRWPRFRLNALGPAAAIDAETECNASTKQKGEAPALELRCETAGTICVSAEKQDFPIGCESEYWFERFGVRWEYAQDANSPWKYLPDAEIDLYGNRISIGQTTQIAQSPATEINTQFYGIIDSVRISRGTSRYSGAAVIPYDPRDVEDALIDEHVIFALNLGHDPYRIPGGTNIRYYVRNRGWQDPTKSTDGLIEQEKNITVTAATTAPIAPFPPTVANISGQPIAILIDGVDVQIDQVVLVKNQLDASQNGLWVVRHNAPWGRATQNDELGELNLSYGTAITIVSGTVNAGRNFYLVTPNNSAGLTPAGGQEWVEQTVIPSLRRVSPSAENPTTSAFYADRLVLAYSNFESGYKNARPGIMFPAHDDFGVLTTQGLYISDIQMAAPAALNRPNIVNVDLATTNFLVSGLFGPQAVDGAQTSNTLDTVLVKNQRNARENGVYTARPKNSDQQRLEWLRDTYDPVHPDNLSRAYIKVEDGDKNQETCWYSTSGDIPIGEAPIYFMQDEIFGFYKDDFCAEAYFKVAGFLHPATTTPTADSGGAAINRFPGRLGQNMTLLDTYRRMGTELTKLESGIRIYFRPVDNEHTGRIYVEIGSYAKTSPAAVASHISNDGWGGPAMQSDVIFAGRFYHVAVTRERGLFCLYVDGVMQDSFIAQARQLALVDRTAAQNEIRYRARAFYGPWHEDKTGFIRCIVRPPEFYYDRETSALSYALDFNGSAGMLERAGSGSNILINLPLNWPQDNPDSHSIATRPGSPVPNYPAPVHVYAINDYAGGAQGNQFGIIVSFWPGLRFTPETIYADLATNVAGAENFRKLAIPNSGHQTLFGLSDFIDQEPNSPRIATLAFDTGIPNVSLFAPFGKSTQITTGSPATFTSLFHGFAVNDTVVFRVLSETTNAGTEELVEIEHGTSTKFLVASHGFQAGQRVLFRSSGSGLLPAGLLTGVSYYILEAGLTDSVFTVSRTPGGVPLSTTAPSSVNTAEVYVSLGLNGLNFGAPYVILSDGFSENVFRVGETAAGPAITCFGPLTGQLYVTNTPALFVTSTPHLLTETQRVIFKLTTTGSLPAGLIAGQPYYVLLDNSTDNSFRVSTSPNGAALHTIGTLTGSLLLIRRPTSVTLTTARLNAGTQFIFSTNVLRVIGLTETVTAIRQNPETFQLIIDTEETLTDGTEVKRSYVFSTSAQPLVAVNDILKRGDILANDPATALPAGLSANTYYYASSEGAGNNAFYFSLTENGPIVYGFSPTLNTTSSDANVRLSGQLIELPLQIDGAPVEAGMRILVKNQNETDLAQNGVYYASATEWQRVPEFNTDAQLRVPVRVLVNGGFLNSNEAFLLDMLSTASPARNILPINYRIGVTPLLFVVDTEGYNAPARFECYIEISRALGGDPRRPVQTLASIAARDAITPKALGMFVKVTEPTVSSYWVLVNNDPTNPYWLEQAEENLDDAVLTALTDRAYVVHTFTVSNVALSGIPLAGAIDADININLNLNGQRIFVRKQTNSTENGVYIINVDGNWQRAAQLSQTNDFFDGLYIVPEFGRIKTLYSTAGFKLRIPPDFELGATPVLCYENPNPIDGTATLANAGFYDNQVYRLTKLYLPINWLLVKDVPILDEDTSLPLAASGTKLSFSTFVNTGTSSGAPDDKVVVRIRTRCKFASAATEVVGRYLILRMASTLGIPADKIAGIS